MGIILRRLLENIAFTDVPVLFTEFYDFEKDMCSAKNVTSMRVSLHSDNSLVYTYLPLLFSDYSIPSPQLIISSNSVLEFIITVAPYSRVRSKGTFDGIVACSGQGCVTGWRVYIVGSRRVSTMTTIVLICTRFLCK